MAVFAHTDAYFEINTVDLSDHVVSIETPQAGEMLDATKMSDTTRTHISGLKTWSMNVTLHQDYATGKTDATINALVGGAAVAIEVRPDSAAASSTNPKWTGNAIVSEYSPVAGTVGDLAVASIVLTSAGALTRAES